MNDLEKYGFLEKIYILSGRVFLVKGYEYYVMYLVNFDINVFKERIKDIFVWRRVLIENIVEEVVKIIIEFIGVILVIIENNENVIFKNL